MCEGDGVMRFSARIVADPKLISLSLIDFAIRLNEELELNPNVYGGESRLLEIVI